MIKGNEQQIVGKRAHSVYKWRTITRFVTTFEVQYSQRGTFINPLTPVVRIIHARSNTATEHPLTLVVMTLAFRDDRTRRFAVVAREGSSRSTVFHRLYNVHVNCLKKAINHQGPPCPAIGIRGVRTPRRAVFTAVGN